MEQYRFNKQKDNRQRMKKWLILIILTQIISSCPLQCSTCTSSDSPYSCISCFTYPPHNLYIKSCQPIQNYNIFTILAIVMIIVHLGMLCLGYGVYRNVYENVQLLAIVSWGYGAQTGAGKLGLVNFGFNYDNTFLSSYGPQFFIAVAIIGIFIILVSSVDRLPHNSMATLIKRKKIIFPIRIQTMIFNIITFTSLTRACTITSDTPVVDIIFAIVALTKQVMVLVLVFYVTNFKNFQIDDHHYYVLIEKLATVRWYARNNLFFSLLCRVIVIVGFVVFFEQTKMAGLIVAVVMMGYTVVSAVGMRYVKIRYWVFNFIGNLLTCACLFCMYGCATSPIGGQTWQQFRKSYYILILILCSSFLLMNFLQIIANSNQVCKQLRSIYNRFIICKKMDDAVQLNKYDSDRYREKVTTFRKNLIYGKNIDDGEQNNQYQLS